MKNDLNKAIEELKKLKENLKKTQEATLDEALNKSQDVLTEIFSSSVDMFYASYEPHSYKRTGRLSNSYVVDRKDNKLIYKFDSNKLNGHRCANNDYLLGLFLSGYHGGADRGDYYTSKNKDGSITKISTPHPDVGVPYYRIGDNPKYFNWYEPAEQMRSFIPVEYINERIKSFDFSKDWNEIFNRNWNKYNK